MVDMGMLGRLWRFSLGSAEGDAEVAAATWRRTLHELVLVVSVVAAWGCAPEPQMAPSLDVLGQSRWVDLSHTYDETTIYWPTGKPYEHIETAWGPSGNGYFYSSFDLFASEHGGTHLDAPIHFAEGGRTTDQIPVEDLVGPAVVIDIVSQAAADADYVLTAADVTGHEAEYGAIAEGSVVLVRTGWSERWPDTKAYMGDDTVGSAENLHFPGIGADAAEVLVARKVTAVGIDTASIDHGPSKDFRTHQILLGAEIPAFENLTNLAELPVRGAWVLGFPMKIGRGSGGPCRVVGLLPPAS